MPTICQHLYNFGEELNFTRMCEVCGDCLTCEELSGGLLGGVSDSVKN